MRKVNYILISLMFVSSLFLIFTPKFLGEIAAESYTIEHIHTLSGEKSISNAGDLNNDGYDDIIIGMKSINDTGEAFIYYGGEIMDDIPDVHLKGEVMGDEFGRTVSTAGDVNGDGYYDVIVGAPHHDATAFNSGSAYIFLGGDPMDNISDIKFVGEYIQDYFGSSISSLYDINRDGFDDVIIGAYNYGVTGCSDCGKVYIFLGGEPMDNAVDMTITGEKNNYLGSSISSAGDINNDGYFDFLIGVPGDYDKDPGRAYLYYGGNPLNNVTDLIFTGEGIGDGFGVVSSASDINNDGYNDILIGAPYNKTGGLRAGKAYLFLGNDPIDNITDKVWIGEYDSRLGYSLCNASDINNDGYDDFIIGAYGKDKAPENSLGAIYIIYGNDSYNSMEEEIIYGYDSFGGFGIRVSSGDINNDGFYDFFIGSYEFIYIFSPNLAPSIIIHEPNGISDLTNKYYAITWTDYDSYDDAAISLYFCAELSADPIPIQGANDISEDDENDTFIWDTTNVDGGSYYIKAKIDDGVNNEVWAASTGKVTINHSPRITITAPNQNNNIADDFFSITWIDHDNEDNALISFYFDVDNIGNDGTLIVSDIIENDNQDSYNWNTTDLQDGSYYIYAEINDGINPIYTNYSSTPLTIHHKMPNLSIQHIGTSPSEPLIDEKVIFNITLINSGDEVAQNCVIELIIDGDLIDKVAVEKVLPDNGTYNVIFEPFTINSKIHSALFRVKMNGEEVEYQEITVYSQEKDELDLIFVLIPILLFVLIITLLLIYLKKRGDLSDKTQKTGIESNEIPVSCPNCSFSFNIPSEPRPLQTQCPNCGTKGTLK